MVNYRLISLALTTELVLMHEALAQQRVCG